MVLLLAATNSGNDVLPLAPTLMMTVELQARLDDDCYYDNDECPTKLG